MSEEITPQLAAKKEKKKSRWTEATCLKVAKRFKSLAEWEKGSPSAYKAAAAKGWLDACKAAMQNNKAQKPVKTPKSA